MSRRLQGTRLEIAETEDGKKIEEYVKKHYQCDGIWEFAENDERFGAFLTDFGREYIDGPYPPPSYIYIAYIGSNGSIHTEEVYCQRESRVKLVDGLEVKKDDAHYHITVDIGGGAVYRTVSVPIEKIKGGD